MSNSRSISLLRQAVPSTTIAKRSLTELASRAERCGHSSPRCWLRAPALRGTRYVRARWAQTLVEECPSGLRCDSREPHLAADDALDAGCGVDDERALVVDRGRGTAKCAAVQAYLDGAAEERGTLPPLRERRGSLVLALDAIKLARDPSEQRQTIDIPPRGGERRRDRPELVGKVGRALMHVHADTEHEHPSAAVRRRVRERAGDLPLVEPDVVGPF